LRATVEHHGFVLVVLDSVYNFTTELDLKDRDVGALYARLKAEVCDPTGCTVALVDHMPWKTDSNRSRLRSYGDVFKNAAVRAGLYIDADGAKLWVEARGNSIRGFKRTPAYWDDEALELRLVDTTRQDEADDELDARVLEWLTANPGKRATNAVREATKARDTRVNESLERLRASARVQDFGRDGGPWSGRRGAARYWIAGVHAESRSAHLFGPTLADVGAGHSCDNLGPAPIGGRGSSRPMLRPGDVGYLEHLYAAFEQGHLTEHEWHELSALHSQLKESAA
jgi:hypothetical protein